MSESSTHIDPPDNPGTPLLNALPDRRRNFCLHYVLGEDGIRGVAYKAYLASFATDNPGAAAASACTLMKESVIKKAIEELRREFEKEVKAKMKPWIELASKGQTLLERALDTALNPGAAKLSGTDTYLTANQLYVIRESLDRALGRPKEVKEIEVGDKMDDLLTRINDAHRKSLPVASARVAIVEPPIRFIEGGEPE